MTPEEARREHSHILNADYARADPSSGTKALETIARMWWEYAVERQHVGGGIWHRVTEWSSYKNPHVAAAHLDENERLIRRMVSAPEVME